MRPMLKAPRTKLLKLSYDEPPSNFAFRCNLRRYMKECVAQAIDNVAEGAAVSIPESLEEWADFKVTDELLLQLQKNTGDFEISMDTIGRPELFLGRAVQVDPIEPTLKAPGTKRLKLTNYTLLSSFAFNFHLRRYTLRTSSTCARGWSHAACTCSACRYVSSGCWLRGSPGRTTRWPPCTTSVSPPSRIRFS